MNKGQTVAVKTSDSTYERAEIINFGLKMLLQFARDGSRGWVDKNNVLLIEEAEKQRLVDETSCY
jgi:hypothetical protein